MNKRAARVDELIAHHELLLQEVVNALADEEQTTYGTTWAGEKDKIWSKCARLTSFLVFGTLSTGE